MTRTLFFGTPDPQLVQYYNIVEQAYEMAAGLAKPTVLPSQLDTAIKAFFAEHNCTELCLHSLGHGVGLDVHEPPRLHISSTEEALMVNEVLAIEPGLYIPGLGGIRIENTCVITDEGAQSLFSVPIHARYF
jgi:Xaa-Pro aminopeptidase